MLFDSSLNHNGFRLTAGERERLWEGLHTGSQNSIRWFQRFLFNARPRGIRSYDLAPRGLVVSGVSSFTYARPHICPDSLPAEGSAQAHGTVLPVWFYVSGDRWTGGFKKLSGGVWRWNLGSWPLS